VTDATTRFSAIVLAAGASSRMRGVHKLLLPIGNEPLIRHTVRAVLEAKPQELIVVTGFQEPAIRSALAGLPIRMQSNPAFEQGQMSSVTAGLRALTLPADAVMVCLADMALLSSGDYRDLVEVFARRAGRSIVVPRFEGQRGNPVIIEWSHLPVLLSGQRNLGCRKLIADHPQEVFAYDAPHDGFVVDIDTPEDYARVVRRVGFAQTQPAQGGAI